MLTTIEALIGPILSILGSVAGATTNNTEIQSIITFLENLIPELVGEATSLVTPVENIISQLEGNASVTTAQMQSVEALRDAIHAKIQAQAQADGLSLGDDDTTTAGT
jgi:formaldehyde-activating enzyme involved in methanogenesis